MENFNLNDEILVQIMVKNVSMSGVVFTYELNYGSPYFVVNYDDVSGLMILLHQEIANILIVQSTSIEKV